MPNVLIEIDESIINQHYYLNSNDLCFYLMNYTSGVGYSIGGANSLILNLKIEPEIENTNKNRWQYKNKAITTCAEMLRESVSNQHLFSWVPIAPSKSKSDMNYDNRLIRVLQESFNNTIHICDIFESKEATTASHSIMSGRPTPEDIKKTLNYQIDCKDLKENIIIFDDVITNGSHFIAYKELILEQCPDKKIVGLFLARRQILETEI